jgi:hypothetical protein
MSRQIPTTDRDPTIQPAKTRAQAPGLVPAVAGELGMVPAVAMALAAMAEETGVVPALVLVPAAVGRETGVVLALVRGLGAAVRETDVDPAIAILVAVVLAAALSFPTPPLRTAGPV